MNSTVATGGKRAPVSGHNENKKNYRKLIGIMESKLILQLPAPDVT